MAANLVEIDSLEVTVIIDNEIDVLSSPPPDTVQAWGILPHIAMKHSVPVEGRGAAKREFHIDNVCCGAHGISLLLTATKGDVKHSLLFDAGPEGDAWQRNAERLGVDLSVVEVIQLSHWHIDHSGGLLRAIQMIQAARSNSQSQTTTTTNPVTIDLHPDRPDCRGFMIPDGPTIAMEPGPSFEDMRRAGAQVAKHAETHTVLDNMFLISGEIPRVMPYETGLMFHGRFYDQTKEWKEDPLLMDERSVMVNLKGKGLVLFTGCAHAGVVNTAKHAVALGDGIVPLYAIMGGYHLGSSPPEQIAATVMDLKGLEPKILAPGHCTGWRAKFEIEKEMPGRLVPSFVGTKLTF